MDGNTQRLNVLLERHTRITADGFSVDIGSDHEAWDECIKSLGVHKAYRIMADRLCEIYSERYGEEFLFSNECVAYELEYHVDAYMTMQGYSGYTRNITTMLFGREELIEHCKEVDISVRDVDNKKQRLMFGYRRGIRDCYKGTDKDPFAKQRRRHRMKK